MARMPTPEAEIRQENENLLKNIMLIQARQGRASVKDLIEDLGLSKNKAYSAVNRLVDSGYLQPLLKQGRTSEKQGMVFTAEGSALAMKILERHQIIQDWLIRLGVPEKEADEEACHMEHGITDRTMKILMAHVEMASRFMEKDATAAEIMKKKMDEIVEEKSDAFTITQRMLNQYERLGGEDGVEKLNALVTRAGGEKRLTALLDLVDTYGGHDALEARREQELALDRMLNQLGGLKGLEKLLDEIAELGGIREIERSVELLNAYGGRSYLNRWLEDNRKHWSELEAYLKEI